jgi:hypothetical protein
LYSVGTTKAERCTKRDKESLCHWCFVTIQHCRKGLPITIIMQDEISVHHLKSKSKWQLMECYHTIFPWKKKFKSIMSAGKIMVFWVEKKLLLLWTSCLWDNSELLTLQWYNNSLNVWFHEFVPQEKSQTVVPSKTTFGHTEACTQHRPSQTLKWQCCHVHPTYSPDFVPSH